MKKDKRISADVKHFMNTFYNPSTIVGLIFVRENNRGIMQGSVAGWSRHGYGSIVCLDHEQEQEYSCQIWHRSVTICLDSLP